MTKLSKELSGASSIPIILSILSTGESYGYEIIQKVKEISEGEIEWGEGTLYPVLHKLEKNGLINSLWKISENGRRRKYYEINNVGKQELKIEKENWSLINSIILKLWNTQPNLT